MSAVSSGPPHPSAEIRETGSSRGPASRRGTEPSASPADFGANEWLVDELYQKYLADPGSVDRAWWSFFADYQPSLPNGTGPQPVLGVQAAAPAPPAAPPPSPQPPPPPVTPPPPPPPAGRPLTPPAPPPAPR